MANISKEQIGGNQVYWQSEGAGGHGKKKRSAELVATSLRASFSLDNAASGKMQFRDAQLGALYAILSCQFAGITAPKTIVMPTGSGKTETMLAAFVNQPELTLVVVPSDALRQQIGKKFITLGILPDCEIVKGEYFSPIVTLLKSKIESVKACTELTKCSNVIVATAAALSVQSDSVRDHLFAHCKRIFFDEAHHVAAKTWSSVVDSFIEKPVLQFTATPYREDRRRLRGEILYTYPLRKAQQDGIFARINYQSVFSDTNVDRAIAQAAVAELTSDRKSNLDHILMARVISITRAEKILKIYQELAPEFAPVRLDSRVKQNERRASLTEINQRRSRIIVCVDMLGEGFDMPQLKIAAIHDPHKSLSVTLQFIGRFTRTASDDLGEATVFVPRELIGIDERLQKLYAEDSDWNEVIHDLSDIEIASQKARDEFERGFDSSKVPTELRSIKPRMSTVVYRSENLEWHPDELSKYVDLKHVLGHQAVINDKDQVLWFVTKDKSSIEWGYFPEREEITYALHVVHCDPSTNLMYINCSENNGDYFSLAKAIGGEQVSLVNGNETFRILHKLQRRVAKNIGLLDIINKNRRFMFFMGGDATEGFGPTAKQKLKTNLFASGFDNGVRASYGVSRKGRVWSHSAATDIFTWVEWAKDVGKYVVNDSIEVDSVMSGFIKPIRVDARPKLVPLGVELVPQSLGSLANPAAIKDNGMEFALYDADFLIENFSDVESIVFSVITDQSSYRFEVVFDTGGVSYKSLGDDPTVIRARKESSLSEVLNERGVIIHFEQETVLNEDGDLLQPDRESPRIELEKLEIGDWSGIEIKKESQGPDRKKHTVQYRTIEILVKEQEWDVIIDDDGPGEVADIVLMRSTESEIFVLLAHCKFSSEKKPGCRLADLYEVCGQAIKSYKAKSDIDQLLRNLLRREKDRRDKHSRTGFVKGDRQALLNLKNRCRFLRPNVTVLISQPGLSKAKLNSPASELLGCANHYLGDTCASNLRILCSE